MRALVTAAHAKGMKVFFDIITNHTADVIDYEQKRYSYLNKVDKPYVDATGKVFDDRDFAGTGGFPALDAAISFPYTPTFRRDADRGLEVPGPTTARLEHAAEDRHRRAHRPRRATSVGGGLEKGAGR